MPHMGEQHVVRAIENLRAEGMTLRQMAHRMTVLNIRSKNEKAKWHPMMVKRIIDNFQK